jgi:hypothetical protein
MWCPEQKVWCPQQKVCCPQQFPDDAAMLAFQLYAHGAEFNANEHLPAEASEDYSLQHDTLCHAGAPMVLLAEIMVWTTTMAVNARHVFCLSGLAGMVKSTGARMSVPLC